MNPHRLSRILWPYILAGILLSAVAGVVHEYGLL
jgi:hypothetical protein